MRRSMKKRMRRATSMFAASAMILSTFAATTALAAEADPNKYSVE